MDNTLGRSDLETKEVFLLATPEAADRSDWINLARSIERNSIRYYYGIFNDASREAAEKDGAISEVYGLLSHVFSMYYSPENANDPFGPMVKDPTWRTATLSDFTDTNLDLFEHLIGKASIASIDARLADVLWLRRKDRRYAERAIESYIAHAQSVSRCDSEDWNYGKESIERAAQLWRQLSRPDQFRKAIFSVVQNSASTPGSEPTHYCRVYFLELMAKHGLCDDFLSWCQTAENYGDEARTVKDFYKARSYWACADKLAALAEDNTKRSSLKQKITDSFVDAATALKSSGASPIIVADAYGKAIEACRRASGRRTQIDELHREMNAIQKEALGEMNRFSATVDVTQAVLMGRRAIDEAQLDQALPLIAKMAVPSKVEKLRIDVEAAVNEMPLFSMISAVQYNSHGRVVARPSAALSRADDEREAGVLAQMLSRCSRDQLLIGGTQIEGAREALVRKRPCGSPIFWDLVTNNPLVPAGREPIFVLGLKAGLVGDYIVCAHLLIPQIENAIRVCMERTGLLVTSLSSDLVQKEHDLNLLLFRPETEQVFGKDLVFALRALLVEEMGGNYRNKLAHGLIDAKDFDGAWINYLWALTIHLCWIGKLHVQHHTSEMQDATSQGEPLAGDEVGDATTPLA